MTPERWQQIKSAFDELLPLAPADRAARLARMLDADAGMHREVLGLLDADAAASGFLERAPLTEVDRAIDHRTPLPARIGPYRIVREIGRGGMGVVLLGARDDEAYQKDVAIKVMRTGGDSGLLRRFTDERRILAQLVHPNIAALLDGGTTDQGQPFLVMEYVEGRPIDAHCDALHLSVNNRLRLFLHVCAAVQHAHQRLVVHRDIKPANILVTADGTPKLLDFGIAKLLVEDGRPGATVTVAQLLTPEYASPEQIRGEAITAVTDVYALGVVLYRLLTGARPYAPTTDRPHELARVICEQDPIRPGSVRRLASDLDIIVLKALQKDPARRYSSVEAFAGDVTRFLERRPVLAHADSLAYRAATFARRHRAGVAAAAAFVIAIVGGAVGTFWQWRVAVANQATAERRFNDVRSLARAVVFDIHDAIEDLPGATKARALVVQKGLEYLDAAGREAAGDRDLQLEIGTGYARIADIQGILGAPNLGDEQSAEISARKALAIREAAVRAHPQHVPALRDLASSLRQMSYVTEGTPEGLAASTSAIRMRERVAKMTADPNDTYLVYSEHHIYGQHLSGDNRFDEALAEYDAARAGYESLRQSNPKDLRLLNAVSLLMKNTGAVYQVQGRPLEAVAPYQRALEADEARQALEPGSVQAKMNTSFSLGSLGNVLAQLDRRREALEYHRRALALREEVLKADPANAFARGAVVRTYQSIGLLQVPDDPAAAIASYEKALRIAGPEAGYSGEMPTQVAWIYSGLGETHAKLSRQAGLSGPAKAAHLREALGFYDHSQSMLESISKVRQLPLPEATLLASLAKERDRLQAELDGASR